MSPDQLLLLAQARKRKAEAEGGTSAPMAAPVGGDQAPAVTQLDPQSEQAYRAWADKIGMTKANACL